MSVIKKKDLPFVLHSQLFDIYLPDTGQDYKDLTKQEILKEAHWLEEKLQMDIAEAINKEEKEEYKEDLKELRQFIKSVE